MKILKPITTPQTILIQPRSSSDSSYSLEDFKDRVANDSGFFIGDACATGIEFGLSQEGAVSIYIRKDGEGIAETVNSESSTFVGNFFELSFSSTILAEGETYSFKVLSGNNIIYKDKIYVTDKTNFTVKHKQAQDNYTPYNPVDDNTYIIR